MQRIDTLEDVATGLEELLRLDSRLRTIAEEAGPLPLRRRPADFAAMAHIVTGQLLSVSAASKIFERLEVAVHPLTAKTFSHTPESALAGVGLSRAKIATLYALSKTCMHGLDLSSLATRPAHEAQRELCAIKGIGRWSADIFLLFCAGHPDIFPSGDLALRVSVGRALGLEDKPGIKDLDRIADAWTPWRGIAARLFWAWYRVKRQGRDTMPI